MIRALWPWLRVLVGVGILAGLGWQFGAGAFVAGLGVIDLWSVLAALAVGLLTTVFNAWRWCLVARRLGLPLPLATAVADYYQALFLNSVLPAGVLGDVHRAVSHGQQSGDLGRGVRAVVLERVAGQVVLVAVGVTVLVSQPALMSAVGGALVPGRFAMIAVLCGLAAVLALAAWARWGRGTSRVRRALRTGLTDARLGLLARDTWPAVALLSAAALAGYLVLFLIAARAAGSQASVAQLLPLLVLALLVMGLPLNVGGWGPREAVSAVAFGAAGLGAAQGLTAAVVYGVLSLIACLPGAGVLILRRRRAGAPEYASGVRSLATIPSQRGSDDETQALRRPE